MRVESGIEWNGVPRELDEAEARGRVQRRPALVVAHVHVGAELLEQQARQLQRALAVRDAQLCTNTRTRRLLTAGRRPQPEAHTGYANQTSSTDEVINNEQQENTKWMRICG